MIAWNNVKLEEVKLMKNNFGGQKCGPKLGFWAFFKFASLVFLDIAHDCSLGQCLTYGRGKTSRKRLSQIRT